MRLIERTARWVDPATFRLLPLWYPEYARRVYMYNRDWSEPRMNQNQITKTSEHKREGNGYANKALTHALGLRFRNRRNWSCCHIWSVDDLSFRVSNAVVQDRRFYSCIANMVLLPSPLKAFTDSMRDVKAMLRVCAWKLYGWRCDDESVAEAIDIIDRWSEWDAYPQSWPRPGKPSIPDGVVPLNDGIRKSAATRVARIKRDLKDAGQFYPRKEVRKALDYWNISV